MEDVYSMKFGKKRGANEITGEEVNKLKRNLTQAETQDSKGHHATQSQLTFRSKSFKDGEEVLSEDSYLFQWKPDYIARNEKYWDKK